jgi:hypothetical protein
MSPSDHDLRLEELNYRAVVRLLAADVFDAAAFEDLKLYLCEKADLIKQEHVVSKQVLQCLVSASQAIETRAEYLPEVRRNIKMAAEFSTLLGLIAGGESCSDRTPGVPRVL